MSRLMRSLKAGFRWPSTAEPDLARAAASEPKPRKPKIAGLGDAIQVATSALGVKPCGGCQRRAAWLNRKFPFDR